MDALRDDLLYHIASWISDYLSEWQKRTAPQALLARLSLPDPLHSNRLNPLPAKLPNQPILNGALEKELRASMLYDLLYEFDSSSLAFPMLQGIYPDLEPGVLAYSTLSLLAVYKSARVVPIVVENLLNQLFACSFIPVPHHTDFIRDIGKAAAISTNIPVLLPESYRKTVHAEEAKESGTLQNSNKITLNISQLM